MNKAIGILGGLLLVGLAGSPANAVTVLATDVGASGTTQIQGSVDTFGGLVPGLTGTLFLEFDGVTNGGLTWNFDYFITNTTSIPPPSTLVARLSSFGLNVTPQVINPNGVVSTGLFSNVFLDPNLVFLGTVDFCASASGSGCSGGGGLLAGESAGGEFTLTFSSVLSAISLDQAFFRFQAIDGVVEGIALDGDSGAGITNGVTLRLVDPPGETPIPGAVWLFGTVLAGGAGFGRWRKKRKQAA